ncbi:hypothetical protein AAFF_G00351300 [Aldrovandia affinis]|uniref:Uncharacterized protein n=1 Tax=Aldrovandia affinis TaxID=143900 RepID=A0AAD7SIZ2_9TELE|nr:hypothetical protein AAFF_G00351300 [Aldrovandia affinis]
MRFRHESARKRARERTFITCSSALTASGLERKLVTRRSPVQRCPLPTGSLGQTRERERGAACTGAGPAGSRNEPVRAERRCCCCCCCGGLERQPLPAVLLSGQGTSLSCLRASLESVGDVALSAGRCEVSSDRGP